MMRIFRALGCFVVICAVLLLSLPASAQIDQGFETGINPYRSYQSGNIDTINTWNGQLNVDIPIISYPQRGGKLQLNFVLHYADLGNWYDEDCSPEPCSYTLSAGYPRSAWGVIQAGTLASAWGSCGTDYNNPSDEICNYSVGFADGSGSSLLPTGNTTWKSPDLQGIQLLNYNSIHPTESTGVLLSDRNGLSYLAGSLPPPGNLLPLVSLAINTYPPGQVEDTNGNYITYQSYGTGLNPGIGWTDTMGRNIPLPISTNVSACPQTPLVPDSAYVWNFPGVNGGTYAVTFCYAEVAYNIRVPPGYTPTGNLDELQSVLLPNGTSWTFQYSTDGNADLSKITFPTGGTLSYTYGYYVSDPCAIHTMTNMREVVTRTLNADSSDSSSGVWTYGNGLVTDPAGNDTVRTFAPMTGNYCPLYETTTQYYNGSHTSGTLLKTVKTGYSFAVTGGGNGIAFPTTTNVLWPNNQQNQVSTTYDLALTFQNPIFTASDTLAGPLNTTPNASYGLPLTVKEYDYSTSPPPVNLLRTTTTTYEALSNSNYLNNNLLTLPASVAVTGSGPGSTTTYSYDQTTPVSSGITTMHSSGPPTGTYRGNPTTVLRYTPAAWLSTTSTFFDTGMPDVITDPNGNPTTFAYSSTYVGALPTSVKNALNQTATFAYDFNTGLLTSTTDPNNLTASNTYDEMERMTLQKSADGGQVSYTYTDTIPSPSVNISIIANSSGVPVTGTEIVDGLGRLQRKELTSDQSGTDYTDYTYDTLGRLYTVSNPYRGASPNLNTTYNYDALSRNTTTTEADGSIQQLQYCGSSTLTVDEAGIWKRMITDGLGRVSEVDEPTSSSATKNACAGQGGPVYATTYTHDVNGNLTGVVQAGSRQRTFVYDSVSRRTSSTNPESNTQAVSPFTSVATTYTYDYDGNVLSMTGPAPNQQGTTTQTISYCYDKLNRMTQKAYTSQTCPMSAPAVTYTYDGSSCLGSPYTCANIGHRTGMTDAAGSESWAYTLNKTVSPEGPNVTDKRTTNSITKTSIYQYNYDGSVASIQYPSGRVITYSYNGAAQPTAATDIANEIGYVADGYYTAFGSPMQQSFGATINRTILYNTRMQPCWSWAGTGTSLPLTYTCTSTASPGTILDMKYNYNLGADNGNIVSVTNDRDTTRSQSYTYDQVNRVATGAASTYATSPANCWGEQFGYDSTGNWGNLLTITPISSAYTGCTQDSLSLTVNAYNRVSSLTYDTAGNVTTIPGTGGGSYVFNAENLITSTASVNYTYDGDNERVEKSSGKIYWRGVDGTILDETDLTGSVTNTSFNEYAYFNGEPVARRDSSNNVFFYVNDQVGSTRSIAEVPAGTRTATLCFDTDYAPFGNQRSPIVSSCTTNYKFAAKELDSPESSLYNSNARFYASFEGRFMSPDRENAGANAVNPQSWNMYSYVLNNPLRFIDPTGLYCLDQNGNEMLDDSGQPLYGNQADCEANGGGWITVDGQPGQKTQITVNGFDDGSSFGGLWTGIKSWVKQKVCAITSPLQLQAGSNGGVEGVGVGGSGAFGVLAGVSGSVGIQVVADPNGNVGVAVPYSYNPGTIFVAGVGVVGGLQNATSSSTDLNEYSSPLGGQGSFSAGFGAGGKGAAIGYTTSSTGNTLTTTVGYGAGPIDGIGAYGAATEIAGTAILGSINCRGAN